MLISFDALSLRTKSLVDCLVLNKEQEIKTIEMTAENRRSILFLICLPLSEYIFFML